jgi:hypothetical protein
MQEGLNTQTLYHLIKTCLCLNSLFVFTWPDDGFKKKSEYATVRCHCIFSKNAVATITEKFLNSDFYGKCILFIIIIIVINGSSFPKS